MLFICSNQAANLYVNLKCNKILPGAVAPLGVCQPRKRSHRHSPVRRSRSCVTARRPLSSTRRRQLRQQLRPRDPTIRPIGARHPSEGLPLTCDSFVLPYRTHLGRTTQTISPFVVFYISLTSVETCISIDSRRTVSAFDARRLSSTNQRAKR